MREGGSDRGREKEGSGVGKEGERKREREEGREHVRVNTDYLTCWSILLPLFKNSQGSVTSHVLCKYPDVPINKL